MALAVVEVNLPKMCIRDRPASFTSSFHGQWVQGGKRLYSVDTINIGNRYSIYGFDGEYTLMGDSGWYVRNEVSSVIPRDVYKRQSLNNKFIINLRYQFF